MAGRLPVRIVLMPFGLLILRGGLFYAESVTGTYLNIAG